MRLLPTVDRESGRRPRSEGTAKQLEDQDGRAARKPRPRPRPRAGQGLRPAGCADRSAYPYLHTLHEPCARRARAVVADVAQNQLSELSTPNLTGRDPNVQPFACLRSGPPRRKGCKRPTEPLIGMDGERAAAQPGTRRPSLEQIERCPCTALSVASGPRCRPAQSAGPRRLRSCRRGRADECVPAARNAPAADAAALHGQLRAHTRWEARVAHRHDVRDFIFCCRASVQREEIAYKLRRRTHARTAWLAAYCAVQQCGWHAGSLS
jgi:hypothetical protein